MRIHCLFALALLALFPTLHQVVCCPASAGEHHQNPIAVMEDFSSSPDRRGWKLFGESELLLWNELNTNLEVTWDSSRSNSYFYLPLGTILTRYDDFSVSLDLTLNDVAAGVDPNKPETFQIAFGFQNLRDAQSGDFRRASENNSPNLVEFNFFPDTGYGPTVWPAILSTNSAINYYGNSDFGLFELPIGVRMRITTSYTASNETAAIRVMTNGVLVGPVTSARLSTNDAGFGKPFTEFMVNTFAVATYSDEGQNSGFSGSILAHGVIDNIALTFPPPPVQQLRSRLNGDSWTTSFLSRSNWTYSLEVSQDLKLWEGVGLGTPGTGKELILEDIFHHGDRARFYRVNSQPLFK